MYSNYIDNNLTFILHDIFEHEQGTLNLFLLKVICYLMKYELS